MTAPALGTPGGRRATPGAGAGGRWIIQPLVDAGVPAEELRTMLFEVAFAAMVGGRELDASLRVVPPGRTPAVQAAWMETIDRMIAAPGR